MCGICGEIRFNDEIASTEATTAMVYALRPRGPDAGGLVDRGRIVFGHRRLSVIDLSPKAEQPMVDTELGLTLVFNGCVYNYLELRTELETLGYRFFSSGDTEVILKAYHAWGWEGVRRLNGMFAFAIHERDSGRIIFARDRFGIKPLYFADTKQGLLFASSVPALLATGRIDKSIDRIALQHYMTFHAVVPPPRTILAGVSKLPPATVRIVEPNGAYHDEIYWRMDFSRTEEQERRSEPEWRDMVLDALRTAVRRRVRADVPLGVLLSGGLDSSLIVGLLAEGNRKDLKTFSIGFESANGEKGDEFVYSDLIADHFATNHTKILISDSEMIDALPGTIAAMSEPMVSYDNVGFYLLANEVSKHVKVALCGQGADEIFAGYHWYPPLAGSAHLIDDYARLYFDRNHERLGQHLDAQWHLSRDEARAFVENHFNALGADDPVDRALRLDSTIMLPDDPVKRVDNMTMAFGIEARVPFLDHELVEIAARIPSALKLANGGKGVLKAVARQIVPDAVIDREKGYFPVPGLRYIEGARLNLVRNALTNSTARERGLFRQDYLDSLFNNPLAAITPLRASELWQVGLLELWLQAQGV